jgi:hypothetical protein
VHSPKPPRHLRDPTTPFSAVPHLYYFYVKVPAMLVRWVKQGQRLGSCAVWLAHILTTRPSPQASPKAPAVNQPGRVAI